MAKQLTKNDVKEIIVEAISANNAIQTEQLKREFFRINNTLAKHDLQFMKLENKIDSIKNDVAKFEDKVMGVIRDMRDEIAVLVGYKDDIEDHGVRIEKLEQKVFPAKN